MQVISGVDTTPRRAIAVFDRYQDTEDFVDRLAERGFPVERLVNVGRDPVSGRRSHSSPSSITARRHEVLVDRDHADEAFRLAGPPVPGRGGRDDLTGVQPHTTRR